MDLGHPGPPGHVAGSVVLAKGQNLVWPGAQVQVEVVASAQCDVSALLLDDAYRVRTSDDFVFYNQPTAPGVTWVAGPPQRITVDLARFSTSRVLCVLSIDPDQPVMGRSPAPLLRLLAEAGPVAEFTPSGLDQERALVGVEIYRHRDQWKVRAVGQGYARGLAELIRAHGVEVDDEPAPSPPMPAAMPTQASGYAGGFAPPPVPGRPAGGPAGFAPTPTEAGRPSPQAAPSLPVNQPRTPAPTESADRAATAEAQRMVGVLRAIMEDISRSTAGLLSACQHAETRLERDLEELVNDPRMRHGPAADQARAQAEAARDDLIRRAEANHQRDMAQLVLELADWEAHAPAELARWDSPTWAAPRPAGYSAGIRLGHLTLGQAPGLTVPYLLPSPLYRPLWIDPELGGPDAAAHQLRLILTRMLTSLPADQVRLDVIDPGGVPTPFAPLGGPGCQVQRGPAATTLDAAKHCLGELVSYGDRVQMAARADLLDEIEVSLRLLVITDFPTGLDEECLALLLQLIEAPMVQIVVVGTDSAAVATSGLAQAFFNQSSRVPAGSGGSLTDGFGGVSWEFIPDAGPSEPGMLDRLLAQVSRGG